VLFSLIIIIKKFKKTFLELGKVAMTHEVELKDWLKCRAL